MLNDIRKNDGMNKNTRAYPYKRKRLRGEGGINQEMHQDVEIGKEMKGMVEDKKVQPHEITKSSHQTTGSGGKIIFGLFGLIFFLGFVKIFKKCHFFPQFFFSFKWTYL